MKTKTRRGPRYSRSRRARMDAGLSRVLRGVFPMVKHLERRGVSSRHLSAERPHPLAEAQEFLYQAAEDPRGNPFLLIAHWAVGCAARTPIPEGMSPHQWVIRQSRDETRCQGPADLAQETVITEGTPEAYSEAEERCLAHIAEAVEYAAAMRLARKELIH